MEFVYVLSIQGLLIVYAFVLLDALIQTAFIIRHIMQFAGAMLILAVLKILLFA
jgi:hypothetical protein